MRETNHVNGSCVHTDKDGDNVFATFDDKTTTLIGTGKFHDTVGGRAALITNHKATWEIK